jgi:hypothetical protein
MGDPAGRLSDWFPLTLTLSLRERGQHSKIRFAQCLYGNCPDRNFRKPEHDSPSPWGEGRGEGELSVI